MRRSRLRAAFVLSLALVGAAAADARVFQMSGQWRPRQGTFDLPANPGSVPGMGLVTATGSAPARLTLMPGLFAEAAPGTVIPLSGMTLVQLTTMIDAMGPQATARFGPGPKPSRPASFSWVIQPPGMQRGRVRYRAGPNQFGGTMRQLLTGGASVSVTVAATGMGGAQILHHPFAFGSAVGAGYAAMATAMLAGGNITLQNPLPTGVITMPGPIVAMGPAETVRTTGFPWTTGQVRIVVPCYCSLGSDTTIVTLTGMDDRTPFGAGHVVLVSGGLVQRVPANSFAARADVLDLTLEPLAVPSLSRTGVAVAAVALLAGYLLRRRA
jgi:hypothetical protein